RTETVSDFSANGSLQDRTVKTTSADGDAASIVRELDGIVDQTETSVIASNGSLIKTVADYSVSGALEDRTVTTISASGLSSVIQRDTTGSGTFTQTTDDVVVVNADGSQTETVTDLNADGSLRDQQVITTSANGLSKTIQDDTTGNGAVNL